MRSTLGDGPRDHPSYHEERTAARVIPLSVRCAIGFFPEDGRLRQLCCLPEHDPARE
jgi:hypothetical protein